MYLKRPSFKTITSYIKIAWKKSAPIKGKKRRRKFITDKRTIYSDIACGWHSGFRPCCILWFLIWCRLPERILLFVGYLNILKGFEYMPCPICFIMNQQHLKPKKCDCCPCLDNSHNSGICNKGKSKSV